MSSVLDYYQSSNGYGRDSKFDWSGLKSAKFGRTIRFLPSKNLIKTNFDMPDQVVKTGRVHYEQSNSFEIQPRKMSLRITPKIQHWHPRQSRKNCSPFKPLEAIPRRQRKHFDLDQLNPESSRIQSLRTFYKQKFEKTRQYSLQNKMQRKVRVDQVELRRTFFRDNEVFKNR